jgi:hypothetical protein
LIYRLSRPDDLAACHRLLPEWCGLGAELRASIPAIWRRLYLDDQLHCGVVVEKEGAEPEAVVAFGMCLFLSDGFVTEYLARPRPYLAALIYQHILAGRSPVLGPRDIARLNASSQLNLAILHFGLAPPMWVDGDRMRRTLTTAQTGFRLMWMGYRLRRVLQEGFGERERPLFLAGGFLPKSDFREWYAARESEEPPPGQRPYLMGLYREDLESSYPGSGVSNLFQPFELRFGFSPAEQRALLHAVMGDADDAIAERLGVSRDAIKKVWRRIYDRVASVDPEMLGPADLDHTRGKEKRRALVRYLSYHLEELRPMARPRRSR